MRKSVVFFIFSLVFMSGATVTGVATDPDISTHGCAPPAVTLESVKEMNHSSSSTVSVQPAIKLPTAVDGDGIDRSVFDVEDEFSGLRRQSVRIEIQQNEIRERIEKLRLR